MMQQVKQALARMSAADRELLLMRFAEQLSIREIAEILTISEIAARGRVRRAIEKLGRSVFR